MTAQIIPFPSKRAQVNNFVIIAIDWRDYWMKIARIEKRFGNCKLVKSAVGRARHYNILAIRKKAE